MAKKTLRQNYLPIFLNITDKAILVVGGGTIAYQKITMLKRFTSKIFVIAKKISEDVRFVEGLKIMEKAYSPSDLENVYLVYACTNNQLINKKIKRDSRKVGILANVVDAQLLCDFITPAIVQVDEAIVAVSSLGRDVKKAIRIRDKIRDMK